MSTPASDLVTQEGNSIPENPGPEYQVPTEQPQPSTSRKRKLPQKPFESLSVNAQKARLKSFCEFALETMEENKITINQLLGHAGRKLSHLSGNLEDAAIYAKIAKGEIPTPFEKHCMPTEEAVALKIYTHSARTNWNRFRKACKRHKFIIPSR